MDKEVSKHKDVLLNLVLFTLREYFYLFFVIFIFIFLKKGGFHLKVHGHSSWIYNFIIHQVICEFAIISFVFKSIN